MWVRVSAECVCVAGCVCVCECVFLYYCVCLLVLVFVVGDKFICWRSQILAELQQCCLSVRRVSICHFVPQYISFGSQVAHVFPAQT